MNDLGKGMLIKNGKNKKAKTKQSPIRSGIFHWNGGNGVSAGVSLVLSSGIKSTNC